MKVIIFAICMSVLLENNIGQNIVPNPSFEYGGVPLKFSAMESVEAWGLFPNFSADYFNKSANEYPERFKTNNMGVPYNVYGYQQARTGNAYVGLAYAREIIQCELNTMLMKDTLYYLEFYANLADKSDYAIWRIGAYFSKEPIDLLRNVQHKNPQILNDSLNYLTDTINWMKISGYYTAEGGEKYVSIGSFANEDNDRFFFNSDKKIGIRYYYIDDVSLVHSNSNNIDTNNRDVFLFFQDIKFDNGSYSLPEISYAQLDSLYSILKNNNNFIVEISGHTDNVGEETENQILSENRAKAVTDYLIKKDICPKRILYKGFGSKKPIASNETDEGQAKNRRIEIKLRRLV